MESEEVLRIAKHAGAVYEHDHVVYTSGLHATSYVDFRVFGKNPELAGEFHRLCDALAECFCDLQDIEAVVGPETLGCAMAARVASTLSSVYRKYVRPVTAHKRPGIASKEFYFGENDRAFMREKTVLVVDDVLTRGTTLKPVIERLRMCRAHVVGFGAFANRSEYTAAEFGLTRLLALLTLPTHTWSAYACAEDGPCSIGTPINLKVGHGAAFVAEHGQPQRQ